MKKLYSLLVLASIILFAGCESNEPSKPQPDPGSSIVAYFTIEKVSPFTYKFTDKSSVTFDSYKWDFGDGDYATTKNTTHTYTSEGKYTVTLMGTRAGQRYVCTQYLTITKPAIYIAGYRIMRIPYENKYYQIKCVDDDWFVTNWGFTTTYTPLLSNSDLPFERYFNNPLEMTNLDGDEYYTFTLYYSNSTSKDGTKCLIKRLYTSEIYKYLSEHVLKSEDNTIQMAILMSYK